MNDIAGPDRSVVDSPATTRRELREARAGQLPRTAAPLPQRGAELPQRRGGQSASRRGEQSGRRRASDAALALSAWDVVYFVVELAVYSGVSVAALRLAGGTWSSLTPLGLVVAVVAIAAMAAGSALWAAPHAGRRPGRPWSVILEYGWMLVGVAGWLVAGLPAIGIPLAGAVVALAVRGRISRG